MTKPFYEDALRTVYNKPCNDMSELPDNSVQMCVTSPPYWGLRKYAGNQDLIWGGENYHEHEWSAVNGRDVGVRNGKSSNTLVGGQETYKSYPDHEIAQTNTCSLCGAWRGAYGLEPTVDLYAQHTIEILREIRRVLRPDGVCFWNLGDCYAGSNMGHGTAIPTPKQASNTGTLDFMGFDGLKPNRLGNGVKPKDLCLIPFRVTLAAQSDGWWVRSVIIWNKPNPMPESVQDRPTDAYEFILMLTKSARYYWDAEAVREPQSASTFERYGEGECIPSFNKTGGSARKNESFANATPLAILPNGRNLRNVWTFSTQPYPGSHFATFPEELPERCIKAATPEMGCCPKCGKPWERVIEKGLTSHDGHTEGGKDDNTSRLSMLRQAARERGSEYVNETKTLGWQPGCKCDAGPAVPSIVLDPFGGSGTTALVAARLGRKCVTYEISEEYCKLIIDRNKQMVLTPNP